MPFSQIILPWPSPTESKRLFYTSVDQAQAAQPLALHLSSAWSSALATLLLPLKPLGSVPIHQHELGQSPKRHQPQPRPVCVAQEG